MLALAVLAPVAFAYDNEGDPSHTGSCTSCHPTYTWPTFTDQVWNGPHGGYATTTKTCALCHDIHASGGGKLLPKATVAASCAFCHNGTGGKSVYGTIAYRGLTPGGRHRIDTTTIVPGGDRSTGGSSTVAFGGQGGQLGCDDCHSPHGANLVEPFYGVRQRTSSQGTMPVSARLVKKRPTGAAYDVPVYGTDWCGACHKGRMSGGVVHNHPVESTATAGYFHASRVARVLDSTSLQTTMAAGLTPLGMVMPAPRTIEQSGHAPICQQCHWNTANIGEPGNAQTGIIYNGGADSIDGGTNPGPSNPRFQNFPHETENRRMLVELDDSLCLNCHPPASLP